MIVSNNRSAPKYFTCKSWLYALIVFGVPTINAASEKGVPSTLWADTFFSPDDAIPFVKGLPTVAVKGECEQSCVIFAFYIMARDNVAFCSVWSYRFAISISWLWLCKKALFFYFSSSLLCDAESTTTDNIVFRKPTRPSLALRKAFSNPSVSLYW